VPSGEIQSRTMGTPNIQRMPLRGTADVFVIVRHEVAQLSVLRHLPGVPGMFLPDPTQACYRRADDGVRSPADNVPNRV
jgi:hypothetical protein